jgi:hypothetical protein
VINQRGYRWGKRSCPDLTPTSSPSVGEGVQLLLSSNYCAMKPPSITNSVPVMNDASSEARNSTP